MHFVFRFFFSLICYLLLKSLDWLNGRMDGWKVGFLFNLNSVRFCSAPYILIVCNKSHDTEHNSFSVWFGLIWSQYLRQQKVIIKFIELIDQIPESASNLYNLIKCFFASIYHSPPSLIWSLSVWWHTLTHARHPSTLRKIF